jgi:A118 family predicted phage portal protein
MYSKFAEWAAWYAGEPQRLMEIYGAVIPAGNDRAPWWRFWSRAGQLPSQAQRALLHVPLASDLASLSGALLFGEMPRIRHPEARAEPQDTAEDAFVIVPPAPALAGPVRTPGAPASPVPGSVSSVPNTAPAPSVAAKPSPFGGTPTKAPIPTTAPPMMAVVAKPKAPPPPPSPAQKAETRLLEICALGGVQGRLSEAAESAAAMGGVYIYPAWDKNVADWPILAVAQADAAIPTFRWGVMTEVTFHRIVLTNGNTITRHLECHYVKDGQAMIDHGLFVGTATQLGRRVSLTQNPQTAGLEPTITVPGVTHLDVEYIPNIRPNRIWRNSPLGVSDYQGSEGLLDALDETYASWMRDVRLGKARLIVPRDFLDDSGTFSLDHEIYTPMDMEPGMGADSRAMLANQFAIRFKEHEATAENLVERIISNAGYSSNTFGFNVAGHADSGTALRIREHRTYLTLRRKGGWWERAVASVLESMTYIDQAVFESGVEPFRPAVAISDSIIDQPMELAQTVQLLFAAQSASVETRVRIIHPEWTDSEVMAETSRINDETAPSATPIQVTSMDAEGQGTSDAQSEDFPGYAPDARANPPVVPPPYPVAPVQSQV